MGTLEIGAISANLLKSNPSTHATFYEENLVAILKQAGCQGIRFLSANVDVEGVQRETVVAIGYTDSSNLTDTIRYDRLPCPPHCKRPGTVSSLGPEPDELIGIGNVASILTPGTFAARFSKDDLETLLGQLSVKKIHVYYGWTSTEQDKPTFLLRCFTVNGELVPNGLYGFDAEPETNVTL